MQGRESGFEMAFKYMKQSFKNQKQRLRSSHHFGNTQQSSRSSVLLSIPEETYGYTTGSELIEKSLIVGQRGRGDGGGGGAREVEKMKRAEEAKSQSG